MADAIHTTDQTGKNFYHVTQFHPITVNHINTLLGRRRLDLEVPEVESVCLEIFADNRNFSLVCLYRPPNARVSSWDYYLYGKPLDL
jgi:hypothetical protein